MFNPKNLTVNKETTAMQRGASGQYHRGAPVLGRSEPGEYNALDYFSACMVGPCCARERRGRAHSGTPPALKLA